MVLFDVMRNLLDAHAMLEATDELLQEHEDQRLSVLVREALLATENCIRESGRDPSETRTRAGWTTNSSPSSAMLSSN